MTVISRLAAALCRACPSIFSAARAVCARADPSVADECYARGADKEIPDIALEVVATRGSIDKLEVYRGLGVREVWVFEKGVFRVFGLHEQSYEEIARSEIFPEVDLTRIAHYSGVADQHAALKAFRDELRR